MAVAVASLLLAACDPAFDEEYSIDNQSSHDVEFVWSGSWRYHPSENGENFDGSCVVPAGEKVTLLIDGGIGSTGRERILLSARGHLMGDSVSFIVGSDTVTFHAADTAGADSPYNFSSPRYTYDELPNRMGGIGWASLTFRVDDAMPGK